MSSKVLRIIVAFIDEIAIALGILAVILYFLYTYYGFSPLAMTSIGAIVAVLIAIVIYKVVKVHRVKPKAGIEELKGMVVTVIEDINPYGKVMVFGEIWKARSVDNSFIGKGERVIIENVDGLTLIVRKVKYAKNL